ncbi:hypothetical protein Bca4012_005421 [Brassica carinata]|uniref:(rape) hypothetical protein n=1 Tax=Brassica napus TaxID=3708 RepID=A0A816IGF1_BRANA|nr:unnamed protein product [Brassica napus]
MVRFEGGFLGCITFQSNAIHGTSLDGHCFEPRIMLQNTYAHQYSKDSQFSEVDRKEYQFRTIAIILNY